jgi:amino acid adenylation domain-containing protein
MGILENSLADMEKTIDEISFLSGDDKKRMLGYFNDTRVDYPADKTLHGLFEEQVERMPDRVAAVGRGSAPAADKEERVSEMVQLTYGELRKRARCLARMLAGFGLQEGDIAGIMVPRSLDLPVGILGVLKSGSACLLIDDNYPGSRISTMLKDSGARFLLKTAEGECPVDFQGTVMDLDYEHRGTDGMSGGGGLQHSHDLAFVIYTSGSTGVPNGVLLHHRGVINHAFTKIKELEPGRDDVFCHNLSIGFVASIWQFFSPLFLGAVLHIYPGDIITNPYELFSRVDGDHVGIVEVVPSSLNTYLALLEAGNVKIGLRWLRKLVLTGEKVSFSLVERFYKEYSIPLVNAYGQSECSDDTLHYKIPCTRGSGVVLLGKPADNTQVYVLSRSGKLQPVGAVGELYISGDGLARGYVNNPGLTALKFVGNPFQPGKRMYKTGDLGWWLPDGNIAFLGRIDHQVKVRGFRIEPGEIEKRLLESEDIKEALVVAIGTDHLCAYLVSGKKIGILPIRERLSGILPAYMIPSYFVQLEKIPLLPNGKIDRRALPEPGTAVVNEFRAPGNEVEKKLAAIWAEELNINKDEIGIDMNFFELGGHSLRATIIISQIHKELDVRIPMTEMFKTPTIAGLSGYIKNAAREKFASLEPVEEKEYFPISSAQKQIYLSQVKDLKNTRYNIPIVNVLNGDIDKEKLANTFKRLVNRHENLRTSFEIVNDQLVQRIHKEVEFAVEYYENTFDPRGFIRPFDLSRASHFRVGLIENYEKEHAHMLMVDIHHIIADGRSVLILIEEFSALYQGLELPRLRMRYKDFSEWQNHEKNRDVLKRKEEYWLKEFEGETPVLNLPYDYARPAMQSFEGSSISFLLNREKTKQLKSLALGQDSTLYMVLLAIYTIWLSKLSGQEEIVVGTPTAGRPHADLQELIGMFVNTLALRNLPAGEKTFNEFLGDVKKRTLAAFDNQEYQFEELVEKVSVLRDTGRNPLFDVMFVHQGVELQSEDIPEVETPDLRQLAFKYENRTSKFDLTLVGKEVGENLFFTLEYCTKLFKKETIQRMVTYFETLATAVSDRPDIPIFALDILSGEEKHRLLKEFNDTRQEYPKDKTIHGLFEDGLEKTPDSIAAVGHGCTGAWMHGEVHITYRDLNKRSNQLAHLLWERGVKPGTIAGIMVERSLEMIIGILGILKTGGAYLPIDPDTPHPRVRYILRDSAASILLVGESFEEEEKIFIFRLGGLCEILPGESCANPPGLCDVYFRFHRAAQRRIGGAQECGSPGEEYELH